MDERQLARILALGRAAIGTAAVVAPGFVGNRWIGPAGDDAGVKVITRAFGVRDAVLGIGLHQALSDGRPAGSWVQAGMASDAVDAVATLVALHRIGWKRGLPVLAVAVSATVLGARLSSTVD
jgi:hypothetical protein